MNLVSIIVPVYNAEEYLEATIQSVLEQTYEKFELILVNDGSTDSSLEICNTYKLKDNRIIIIDQPNAGVSSARNAGLDIAKGQYIQFVDSDDIILDSYLKKSMDIITEDSAIDLVVTGYTRVKSKEDSNGIIVYPKNVGCMDIHAFFDSFDYSLQRGLINYACNKVFKASIIQANKLRFEPSILLGEDLLFNLEYLKYVNSIYSSENSGYMYRIGDNKQSLSSNYKHYFFDCRKLMCFKIQELFNFYEYDNPVIAQVLKQHKINTIIYSVLQLASSNLSKKEKQKLLEEISKDHFTIEVIKSNKLSLQNRVIWKLAKNNRVGMIQMLLKVKDILKG